MSSNKLFSSILIAAAFFVMVFTAQGQVPQMINYQGQLTDNSGNPANGTFTMIFKIYDAASAGSQLYAETQNVTVSKGVFNVLIGSANPIPLTLFDSGIERYLEITVNGTLLTPRHRFGSVPYAFTTRGGSGGGWTDDGSTVRLTTAADNVGIGTTTPKAKLEVSGAPALPNTIIQAVNTGRGSAITAESAQDDGILGISNDIGIANQNPAGVHGIAKSGKSSGVRGQNFSDNDGDEGHGVAGYSNGFFTFPDGPGTFHHDGAGVYGENTATGDGVRGYSENGTGVTGRAWTGKGVCAYSQSGIGIYGESISGFAGAFHGTVYVDKNISIGTKTIGDGEKLSVVGGAITTDNVFGFSNIQQRTSPVGVYISAPTNQAMGLFTNSSERIRIDEFGRIGINTTTPLAVLHVNGDAIKPGGGSWGNTSDIRLKKNIATLEGALDKILQLRGVTYEWIDPEKQGNLTGTQMGMIAQEVEKVFPEWVETGNDGYKILTVRGFDALTIEAIRELKAENESLKAQIIELQAAVESLLTSK